MKSLFRCLIPAFFVFCLSLPLAAQDDDDGMTCQAPTIGIQGWEDAETLFLYATSEPAREFKVQVGLTSIAGKPLADAKACADSPDDAYEYIFCDTVKIAPPAMVNGKAEPQTRIVLKISKATFSHLLGKDGDLHIHFQNVDGCDVEGWRHSVTAFDRSVLKMEAGVAYSRDGAGNWDPRGEASVRFSTRWHPNLSGAVEFRYAGLSNSAEEMDPPPSEEAVADDDSEDGNTDFNPFTATDGILRGDFYLGYHLGRLPWVPSLANSIVGGFGLSTLRGVSDSTSEFSDTRRRLFLGYRLSVPRYHVDGIDEIINPRGYIQFSYAYDDLWKFTVPSADASGVPVEVDERGRFVVEGTIEFLQIGTDNNKIPLRARIYWDTQGDLSGESEVRISVLTALNLFRR